MPVRRKKKAKILLPLASMGDIAFLLIIFFMLVSSFMKNNAEFDPAVSADIKQTEQAAITVVLDKKGQLWIDGQSISVSELTNILESRLDERRRDTTVHVSIDKNSKRKDFIPIIESIAATGVKPVFVGQKGDS